MRVTNAMLLHRAINDLDGLRKAYAKAQASVNGRVLERPSEDPQLVAEAMDLSGAKLRIERAQKAGQDAKQWLSVTELSLHTMIERMQTARELAVQAGSPGSVEGDAREALAQQTLALRDALTRELNIRHRDQYLFAGWRVDTKPFADDGSGGVTYISGSTGEVTRDIAPGLSLAINLPGNRLMEQGDFMKSLTDMAEAFRSGNLTEITGQHLTDLDRALGHLTTLRSDMGTRQNMVEQYEVYAESALFYVEDRLTNLTGADLATAVMRMTEAQTAYQTALASFAKALPNSLVDYMLR